MQIPSTYSLIINKLATLLHAGQHYPNASRTINGLRATNEKLLYLKSLLKSQKKPLPYPHIPNLISTHLPALRMKAMHYTAYYLKMTATSHKTKPWYIHKKWPHAPYATSCSLKHRSGMYCAATFNWRA